MMKCRWRALRVFLWNQHTSNTSEKTTPFILSSCFMVNNLWMVPFLSCIKTTSPLYMLYFMCTETDPRNYSWCGYSLSHITCDGQWLAAQGDMRTLCAWLLWSLVFHELKQSNVCVSWHFLVNSCAMSNTHSSSPLMEYELVPRMWSVELWVIQVKWSPFRFLCQHFGSWRAEYCHCMYLSHSLTHTHTHRVLCTAKCIFL